MQTTAEGNNNGKEKLAREATLTRRRVGQQQQQEQQEAGRAELHAGRGGERRVLDSSESAAPHTARRRRHEAAAAQAPEWRPWQAAPQRSFTVTRGRRWPECRPDGGPPSHRSASPGPAATRGHGATASTRARRRGGGAPLLGCSSGRTVFTTHSSTVTAAEAQFLSLTSDLA